MKLLLPILLAAIAACNAASIGDKGAPKQWALLVAGSSSWENYRHQADIAHAYKILRRRGIPAANIVVMMYDDVARNPQNPQKGKLFNRPNGPDVYKGIKIDYKGEDVTPQNFLEVLSGNNTHLKGKGTGRVIASGPNDHVFVNFADHGGSGILCFPRGDLNAEDLINTLKQLTKDKKYGQLVFYVEACEAGSNFDALLPENTKILVSTASAFDESSWGCYCSYKTFPCLGDLYSVQWMEHMDKKISANENLFDQYQLIRHLTTKSHVQLYGDYSVGPHGIKDFIGPKSVESEENIEEPTRISAVSSRDATLHYYKRMAKVAPTEEQRTEFAEKATVLIKKREFVDQVVDTIIGKIAENDEDLIDEIVNQRQKFTEQSLNCHVKVYKHFSNKCFNLNENQYVLKHFYKFANICHLGAGYKAAAIEAIDSVCHEDFPVITETH